MLQSKTPKKPKLARAKSSAKKPLKAEKIHSAFEPQRDQAGGGPRPA